MDPELKRAAELAAKYIDSLGTRPIQGEADPAVLTAALRKELSEDGVPGERVIEELCADIEPGLLHTASGRFFGWVIGGGLPASVGADWLTTAWDQNAAAYSCSPSAAVVEEIVGEWLKEILHLPPSASYAFVTGCQMAHVTGLAAARQKILADRGWSVGEQGLAGSPPIRVLGGEHHETLIRGLRMLGIGKQAFVQVAQLDDGTLDVDDLGKKLTLDNDAPTIVALAAGDLNRGAFDPFDAACDMAHEHGAWVHVDGAFGLWAAASDRLRPLVKGLDKADSWATDGHKWLNVPYDSGIAFVADAAAHRASMTMDACYKVEVAGARDEFEWNPEWSRRARGIPIYAALRTLGKRGVGRMIESNCDMARELVRRLGELPGVEVLAEPIINQGLVRFLAPESCDDKDHDAFTDQIIPRINATGEAWFGPTTWYGKRVMRISVSNFRTNEADLDRTVAAVRGVLEAAQPSCR